MIDRRETEDDDICLACNLISRQLNTTTTTMGNQASSDTTDGKKDSGFEADTDPEAPQEPSTPRCDETGPHVTSSSRASSTHSADTPSRGPERTSDIPKKLKETDSYGSGLPKEPKDADLCNHCQVIKLNDRNLKRCLEESQSEKSHSQPPQPKLCLAYERRTIYSINETAATGCSLCQLMRASFETYVGFDLEDMNRLEGTYVSGLSYCWEGGLRSLDVEFLLFEQEEEEKRFTLAFPITVEPEYYYEQLRISKRPRYERLLSRDGAHLSQEVCERLYHWIQHCIKHGDPEREPETLPKRLLNVKIHENTNDIYLIETQAHGEGTWKYATLSHCWGPLENQPIKTTRANLCQMTAGISMKDLPKTYRDAVIVCRGLQIPYLWIDSLCILQDDKTEWESESQKVAELYKQAFVTIIPSVSQSCHDSFLERFLPKGLSVKVPVQWLQESQNSGFYFINEPDFSDTSLFYRDTAKTKWGNRGWTFSEQLFSTRRIYFGTKAIHWSCRGFYSSEMDYDPQEAEEYTLMSLAEEPGLGTGENIYSFWCNQFLEYSCRKFTFWDDRLPAISALASFVAKNTKDKWLAGIWKSDMHIELLWSATKFHGPIALPRTPEYIAPSWSWLARAENAEISHMSIQQNLSFITVLDSHIEVDGTNSFGRVQDGYIKLAGIVCVLSRDDFYDMTQARKRSTIYEEVRLDGNYVGDCCFDSDLFGEIGQAGSQNLGTCFSDTRTVVLLPIRNGLCLKRTMSRAGLEGIDEEQVQSTISGLILVPSGREDDEYCRAGIFESPPLGSGGPSFFEKHTKGSITII